MASAKSSKPPGAIYKNVIVRNCTVKDIDKIRQFVNLCKPLTLHTPYTYYVLFTHFSDSCLVIEENNSIRGYISGIKSVSLKDTFFIWQIGVEKESRGKGCAYILIEKIMQIARKQGCTKVQFTIEPDNDKSFNTFNNFAKKNNISMKKLSSLKFHDSLSQENGLEIVYEFTI